MARHQKVGLMYFPLDTDIFTDRKIRILQAKFGCEGTTFYLYLISSIYKEGYYLQANEDLIYIISSDLKIEYEKVLQIMEFFFERSLFDRKVFEEKKILTSLGIQRRYQLAVKARGAKRNIKVDREIWLLDENETLPFIVFEEESEKNSSKKNGDSSKKNTTNKSKVNKSKVNQRKGKESKVVCQAESGFDEIADEPAEEVINETTDETVTNTTTAYEPVENEPETDNIPALPDTTARYNDSDSEPVASDRAIRYDDLDNEPFLQTRSSIKSVTNRDCLKIPAKNGLFIVSEELYERLCAEYPDTDIEACLSNIKKYLLNNPHKQRSKNSTEQYIELWISNDAQCNKNPRKPRTYPATYDIEEYESWSVIDDFEPD